MKIKADREKDAIAKVEGFVVVCYFGLIVGQSFSKFFLRTILRLMQERFLLQLAKDAL